VRPSSSPARAGTAGCRDAPALLAPYESWGPRRSSGAELAPAFVAPLSTRREADLSRLPTACPADLAPAAAVAADGSAADLRVEFDAGAAPRAASEYALALCALFADAADSFRLTTANGSFRDGLDAEDVARYLRSPAGSPRSVEWDAPLRFRLVLAPPPGDSGAGSAAGPAVVTLSAPVLVRADVGALRWLQPRVAASGPVAVLAVPLADGGLVEDSLHPLVALAAGRDGWLGARLERAGEVRAEWAPRPAGAGWQPLVDQHAGACWGPAAADSPAAASARAWFRRVAPAPRWGLVGGDLAWWTELNHLCAAAPRSAGALASRLHALAPLAGEWALVPLAELPPVAHAVPPEDGVVAVVAPGPGRVVLAVDFGLAAEPFRDVLLHGFAHLCLGHLRADDEWAHWDTLASATAPEPRRAWDRAARAWLAERLGGSVRRRVASLADCTAKEKAQLGLWRMVGELLGESRRLHERAERYQRAAYQRQAAQRMVAMFEEYAGALLCDGVGLGKTYIATTLMVHYANAWRDRWAATPERALSDPFRVSVLAPNSVVSTWRREALPALAAWGVPLTTVRVLSHTNRPEEEVVGYRRALDWVHTERGRIDLLPATCLRLHALAQGGTTGDAGVWKSRANDIVEVFADGRRAVRFRPLAPALVPAAMAELFLAARDAVDQRRVTPLLALASLVLDFTCIHPFRDGNGRVSRLLLLLALYHQGFEVGRYVSVERIIEQTKDEYYATLKESSDGWHEGRHDVQPWFT
jgi:hypothetical protein